jgi:chemotaxis protein CheX
MSDRKRILLADDEEETIIILSAILSGHGFYEIVTANDGLEAYRKARNQKFDIICTDFKMPKLSGMELINALREAMYNKSTPIIIVTSDLADSIKNCDSGTKKIHFLEKPVSDDKFIALIEKATSTGNEPIKIKQKAKLDVGFVNPFIDATIKTIEMMGSAKDITNDKPVVIKKGEEFPVDISGVVTMMSPQFNGSLAVCFPAKTFLNIVTNMLGEPQPSITPENKDAAAELTNIIFGQTKSVLNEKGYKLEKAIPSVITGKDHFISNDPTVTVMRIPFKCNVGEFYIQILMGDSK